MADINYPAPGLITATTPEASELTAAVLLHNRIYFNTEYQGAHVTFKYAARHHEKIIEKLATVTVDT